LRPADHYDDLMAEAAKAIIDSIRDPMAITNSGGNH
jgi:hypothetical protein